MLRNDLNSILVSEKVRYGISVYEEIQRQFEADIELDKNVIFMELFDNFYGLHEERKKFKDINLKKQFFICFESYKKDIREGREVTFERILREISELSNQCERAFATKIYHTLYNDKPILDSVLAQHFKIKFQFGPNDTIEERYECVVNKYLNDYIPKFEQYLKSQEGKNIIKTFREKYNNIPISNTKIIDFVLWGDR